MRWTQIRTGFSPALFCLRPGQPRAFRVLLLALLLAAGCASPRRETALHPFDFYIDTFSYSNQLVWQYEFDPHTSQVTTSTVDPPPTYSQHCFVVARSARQFFSHARFDVNEPVADERTYQALVRRVIARSPRRESAAADRVVVPGYASLRDFSADWTPLLQAECGGAWQSYVQRGHWRIVFPFSRANQERVARTLLDSVRRARPAIVHVVRFPAVNHALLVFEAEETREGVRFEIYDPNNPSAPVPVDFVQATRTFHFGRNNYFVGGPVNLYEIYRGWCY